MATSTQTRDLYMVTRSEATQLVNMYMDAQEKGVDGSIEPYRVFRDALETAKPAYLGKYNGTHEGIFYKMALELYNIIDELNYRVDEPDHMQKQKEAAKHLPCRHSIGYLTAQSLNWSLYNWYNRTYSILEDLGDNFYEKNTCAICSREAEDWFYFSTSYGLEMPVCESCLPDDEKEDEQSEEYVCSASETDASETDASETGSASETDASETGSASETGDDASETDDDDEDYEPSETGSESEEEDDDDDASEDEDDDASETGDEDASASETASETGDDDASETASETDASETGDADSNGGDDAKYSASHCNFEWRDGWKHGYRAAIKDAKAYADRQRHHIPAAPRCANCDISWGSLSRCSGTCGGCVRYCSKECQTEHWPQHKATCHTKSLIL